LNYCIRWEALDGRTKMVVAAFVTVIFRRAVGYRVLEGSVPCVALMVEDVPDMLFKVGIPSLVPRRSVFAG
jgi:hypothetical protein